MILFTAGETIGGNTIETKGTDGTTIKIDVPGYLQIEDTSLKNICRYATRNRLLNLDSHRHLFGRIPKLGRPSALASYLLYNISLDGGAKL